MQAEGAGEGGPPPEEAADGGGEEPPTEPRPKWLSFVGVSAIVVGSLFGSCGLAGIGSLVAGRAVPLDGVAASGAAGPAAEAQRDYLAHSQRIQQELFPLSLSAGLLGLAHAMALTLGGILAYQRKPRGRRLLVAVFFAGVAIDGLTASAAIFAAQRQVEAVEPFMERIADASAHQGGDDGQRNAVEVGAMVVRFTSVLTWLMVGGLLLLKSAYYIASGIYLKRADVIRYFESAGPATP